MHIYYINGYAFPVRRTIYVMETGNTSINNNSNNNRKKALMYHYNCTHSLFPNEGINSNVTFLIERTIVKEFIVFNGLE